MMNVSGISPIDAVRGAGVGVGPTVGASSVGDNFEAMFAKVASSARDAMRAGEAAAISGVSGDTSVQKVVQAMMTAEEQLRAAVAVRDRVVAAYQEIARMQI